MAEFIQILGTSGSGKTTAMRKVIAQLDPTQTRQHFFDYAWTDKEKGRARCKTFLLATQYPALSTTYPDRKVFVVGSYEAVCGGMDSLSAPGMADTLYNELKLLANDDCCAVFLMEGLIQAQPNRAIDLVRSSGGNHEVHAYKLNTPLDVCLARVEARRKARGDERPLNPQSTTSKFNAMRGWPAKLLAGGCTVTECSGDEAAEQIIATLRM